MRNQLSPSRRRFLRASLTAAAVGAIPGSLAADNILRKEIDEYAPGNIKLSHRVPSDLSEDDLHFLQQIGLRYARVNWPVERSSLDEMRATRDRFKKYGIEIYSGVQYAYRSLKVQLGQPGRDEDIAGYQQFIRNLGEIGGTIASYDFHPGNTYTTSEVETARSYTARKFDLEDFRKRVEKQMHDRVYTADDIWANYTYLMKAILPVAKEANVKLALHPDDPPLEMMNGVAKVFVHYDGYKRAEEISDSIEGKGSPHWGLTFCVGTWSEGGETMGKDVFEMIKDFGGRGKIEEIHFRSVTSPLPSFIETFPDEGYLDMYAVMKALRQVKFNGMLVPDHIPQLVGDSGMRRAGTAYAIAAIRALLRRANEEVG
jgi:mannonate dehydratase